MQNPSLPLAGAKNSTNVRKRKIPLALRFLRFANPALAAVSSDLAARWAARQFTTPMKLGHSKYNRDILLTADHFFVPYRGGRLAVWSWGKGPAILLAHGWAGRGSQLARFVAPLVKAGYRAITFDAPGHGQSSGNRSSLPEFAAGIQAIAKALGPVHAVIAHSMGGAATTVALRNGMKADRVAFLGSPSDMQASSERFARFVGVPSDERAKMQVLLERRFGIQWSDMSGPVIAPAMTIPALMVHDRGDAEVPYAEGLALAGAWPGAKFVTTNGLGHNKLLRDMVIIESAIRFVTEEDVAVADIGVELQGSGRTIDRCVSAGIGGSESDSRIGNLL